MLRSALISGHRFSIFTGGALPVTSAFSGYQQSRSVYSKYAIPDYAKGKPEPWPYKERGYRNFHMPIDYGVTKRFDENSKLIIVEGNIGAGKSTFARDLAERLGFYHIPDPPVDDLLIDSYGDDRRVFYHLYPETMRDFDTRMFYEQPRHRNVAEYQKRRFLCRYEAYLNALAHILNTGQGVVLERHYVADQVFVEAMYKKKYLSDPFRWHYYKFLWPCIRTDTELQPHLIIYLDCPISKCMENIKKHHKKWEWDNEVMDYSYLENIEKGLKAYLKEYSRHSEVLKYDWSDGGDVHAVAEDVEKMDLDSVDVFQSEKLESWYQIPNELYFTRLRHMLTSNKWEYLQYFYIPSPEVEELFVPIGDRQQQIAVHNMLFGKYASGFRKDRGDSPFEMAISWIREFTTNKTWTEYLVQDQHHIFGHDIHLSHPREVPAPSFPEDFMLPQSPYKSDGGCMADAELFMDESGHLMHHGH